jgi:uncharacterized membrane protein
MVELPPLPGWDGLHPLVVHFPVALLLVAPLFVLVALFLSPARGRAPLLAALALIALGTVAPWVAAASGEAAGKLAERSPEINAALERHEDLAEATRTMFSGLTLALAAILFGPALLRRQLARAPLLALLGAFLVTYAAGAALLANTAHNGGRLVHQLGVRAWMPDVAPTTVAASAPQAPGQRELDED